MIRGMPIESDPLKYTTLLVGCTRRSSPRVETPKIPGTAEKSFEIPLPQAIVTNGAFQKRGLSAGKNVPYPYCNRLFSTYIMSSQVGDPTLHTRSPESAFKRSASSPSAGPRKWLLLKETHEPLHRFRRVRLLWRGIEQACSLAQSTKEENGLSCIVL